MKAERPMMDALKVCCRWSHLKATGGIALFVGTWLTFVNQADVIAAQGFDKTLLVKIALNYLTPFVVSNLGLLARKT
jgi:hypothetical protein